MRAFCLAFTLVGLLIHSTEAADQIWRDCELAAKDADRSISGCTKFLSRKNASKLAQAPARHYRALAYLSKGELDKALSDLNEAIRLSPQYAFRYQDRGLVYWRKGDLARAIAEFNEAIRLDPTRPHRFTDRAFAYKEGGDLNKAVEDFTRAIALDPTHAFRFLHRGEAYRELRQFDKALVDIDEAIRKEPKNASFQIAKGLTMEVMGDTIGARSSYELALALEPANEDALQGIRRNSILPSASPAHPGPKKEDGITAPVGKRIALIIGNSAYRHVSPLGNPTNDARLMAETLRSVGFTIIGGGPLIELTKTSFDSAIQRFGLEAQGADVALFYYAGHGIQVRGTNYLAPVDANPTREADVDFQFVDANLALRQLEAAGTRLNIVILDACRNNPFGGRSLRTASNGLAHMQAPDGTLISYATQPGNVAQDGIGGNSPYTKVLAQVIRQKGLELFQAFNAVGIEVKKATGGTQVPWLAMSPISGSFYFVAEDRAENQGRKSIRQGTSAEDATVQPSGAQIRPDSDVLQVVREFYVALGRADGPKASALVIPEKQTSGPLRSEAISTYYSALREPLRVTSLTPIGNSGVHVAYIYRKNDGSECNGASVVELTNRGGRLYIEKITALRGC